MALLDVIEMKKIEISEFLLNKIIQLRRELHQYPETCFEEFRTAKKVVESLEGVPGVEITTGIAKTGVVVLLEGDQSGPCIALRADMDALPIEERPPLNEDRPWISKVPGKMHACGHDGHTAALVGAIHLLAERRDEIKGVVKFIFQPAEEDIGGALVMCQEGVLENPRVSAIFAMHNWPSYPVGHLLLTPGPVMAQIDDFVLLVKGKGGHAAAPHLAIDPIMVASQIVVAAQALVARTVSPFAQAVVSFCQFQGGTVNNVIPEEVKLAGTIRTYLPEVREALIGRFREVVSGMAGMYGASVDITIEEGYPAVINDTEALQLVAEVGRELVDEDKFNAKGPASMGGEDFAYFLQRVPGAFWRVGGGRRVDEPNLHTPQYDFPDEILPIVMRMHVGIALKALEYYRS